MTVYDLMVRLEQNTRSQKVAYRTTLPRELSILLQLGAMET